MRDRSGVGQLLMEDCVLRMRFEKEKSKLNGSDEAFHIDDK